MQLFGLLTGYYISISVLQLVLQFSSNIALKSQTLRNLLSERNKYSCRHYYKIKSARIYEYIYIYIFFYIYIYIYKIYLFYIYI